MDRYFIVADLEFPGEALAAWLDQPAADEGTLAKLFDDAEGALLARADGARFVLRAVLIDHEFFAIDEPLAKALVAAAKLGAKGRCYSGDDFNGTTTLLSGKGKPQKTKIKNPGAVWRAALDEANAFSASCQKRTAPARKPLGAKTKKR